MEEPVARTVLVAGGTGALGVAVTRRLARDGWRVVATWRTESGRANAADRAAEDGVELAPLDARDPEAVDALVAGLPDLHAVVDLIGGYRASGRVHEAPADELEQLLSLNLLTAWHLARCTVGRLAEAGGGAFVAVSAKTALQPGSGAAAYSTAKAGVLALVRALDAEYRRNGVRCNVVVPSVIDTPANRRAQPDADHSRWVSPDDIAAVVAFLVSDAARVVSGSAVPVPGRS